MHKNRQKEKHTGEDNNNYLLIPNKSLGIFILGDYIEKYLYLSHVQKCENEERFSYNSYEFYNGNIEVWLTEDNRVRTIHCDKKCYWKNQNLIGMNYNNFLILTQQEPNEEDIIYIPVSTDRGQNQKVYDFDDLGLQVWVWREKIRTVLVTKYEDEE